MLPADKLPVTSNVPAIFAPVPVTTKTLAVPLTLVVTFPPAVAMLILLLPFATPAVPIVMNDNPPEPFVLKTCPFEPPVIVTLLTGPKLLVPVTANVPTFAVPVVVKFPPVILAVTVKALKVPTLVIFGCAFVVRAPDTKLAVTKLPRLALDADILPVTVSKLVVLSKVKLAFPPNSPISLN